MRALTIAVTVLTLAGLSVSQVAGQNAGQNQGKPPAGNQNKPDQNKPDQSKPKRNKPKRKKAVAAATYTNPRFDPATHGFHFKNAFTNSVYVGSLKPITTRGRCGGMSYAAMDYFYHPSYGVPGDRETPPDGDVYGEYISNRLMDSWKTVAPKTVQALIVPNRSSTLFRKGLGDGGNFKIFRSMIDSNKLCNLLMIESAGGAGIFKAGDCHQVTGIGYCDAPDPRKVRLHIYDNCYPDVEMVLVFDPMEELIHQCPLKPSGELGETVRKYKCYWPDTGYCKKTPPDPAHPKVVNDCSGRDLRRWTPRSQDLRSYRFTGANLAGTGGLSHSDFEAVQADRANFSGTRLRQCDFRRASLTLANLVGTDLRGSTLNKADLTNASFGNANLGGAKLRGAYTRGNGGPGPVFVRTALQDAEFDRAQLPRAQFTQAKASKTRFDGANLSSAEMRETTLAGCSFTNANLSNVSFYKSTMSGCGFEGGKLSGASFQEAAIAGCRFNNARLSGASFQKAAINTTHFEGTDLRNADFAGASLATVWFDKNTKLAGSKWRGVAVKGFRGPPEVLTYIMQHR